MIVRYCEIQPDGTLKVREYPTTDSKSKVINRLKKAGMNGLAALELNRTNKCLADGIEIQLLERSIKHENQDDKNEKEDF